MLSVKTCAPALRATREHMCVVEQTVEHRADSGDVAEEFAPVVDGAIGCEERGRSFVAAHDDLDAPYYPRARTASPHLREDGQTVYYLNPAGRPAESERSFPVTWIIFPHYAPDVVTELRPVSRPEALRRLLHECLVPPERMDRAGVESLVHWIRSVECFELLMSSLTDAVDLVNRLGRVTRP
jgi:hypothetical protein